MNKETKIQHQVMVCLSEHGYIPIRMNVGTFYTENLVPIKIGISGMPDLMVIDNDSKVFWVEMKTPSPGSKLREDQKNFHLMLQKYGHDVYVIRSVKEMEEIINARNMGKKSK